MNEKVMKQAKSWIYRNARPVDLARFQYHFEQGSKEAVATALQAYQNEDGGFGHALEADCFNPDSAPIQTWVATEILWEIQMTDGESEIIANILKYLESGKDFNGKAWSKTIPSNDQYPRASWWTYTKQEDTQVDYNPTVALAGFALMYANQESEFYDNCIAVVQAAVEALMNTNTCDEMHTLSCFVRMTEYLRHAKITNIIDMEQVEQVIREKILSLITKETDTWATAYVCKPSQFIHGKDNVYYETIKEIAEYECEFIKEYQQEDGTWSVNWDWQDFEEEWHVAKNWWKADIVVKNLWFLDGIQGQ